MFTEEEKRRRNIERATAWNKANPDRRRAIQRKYNRSEASKQKRKEWHKSSYIEGNNYKIQHLLRNRLNRAIKNNYKTGSAVQDLGCSIEYLNAYLEGQFESGMTWANYGEWEIDHIRPLVSFDLTDPEQFKQAVHYTNLQPLWKKANREKGKRV